MIDKKWVEENINDEEVKEFLIEYYVDEDSPEHETVQDLIDDIISTENDDIQDTFPFETFEDLDSLADFCQMLSKTLKILDTFVD